MVKVQWKSKCEHRN